MTFDEWWEMAEADCSVRKIERIPDLVRDYTRWAWYCGYAAAWENVDRAVKLDIVDRDKEG